VKGFKNVSPEEFARILDDAPLSPVFRSEFTRYEPSYFEGWFGPDCMVHEGDLTVSGDFTAPGFYTLIIGNLVVGGHLSLDNPYDKGFEEGGLFVVVGDVRCRSFSHEFGKVAFIDGDLEVRDLILNFHDDASLVAIGTLKTYFFYSAGAWAEVGIGAFMEYGVGVCLPLGWTNADLERIEPRHDEETSLSLLDVDDPEAIDNIDLEARFRQGHPIFKRR
jgi:hypothetical protein